MDDPTLIIHWLFSWLALAIMALRLGWKHVSKKRYNMGDYLTVGAILCVLARLGFIHIVLTWGTNNIPKAVRKSRTLTAEEIYRRGVGSRLAIANRFVYNSYLWIQKLVLLDVYRRLMANLHWEKVTNRAFLVVFFLTYVAVQVLNVAECRPVRLYWQVVPDPGACVQAQVQLVVLGVLNIFTDVMLLLLPLPVVMSWDSTWRRKLKFYILFTLGIFVIAVTVIRLPINALNKSNQLNRTTWATVELLTAAIVVNAPTLHGLWNASRHQASVLKENHDRSDIAIESWRARDSPGPGAGGVASNASLLGLVGDRPADAKQMTTSTELSRDNEGGRGSAASTHDAERTSVHSSQRGILHDEHP